MNQRKIWLFAGIFAALISECCWGQYPAPAANTDYQYPAEGAESAPPNAGYDYQPTQYVVPEFQSPYISDTAPQQGPYSSPSNSPFSPVANTPPSPPANDAGLYPHPSAPLPSTQGTAPPAGAEPYAPYSPYAPNPSNVVPNAYTQPGPYVTGPYSQQPYPPYPQQSTENPVYMPPPAAYTETPYVAQAPAATEAGPVLNGPASGNAPTEELPATANATETTPPPPVYTGAWGFWYEYFDPWDGNVELGMNGTAGNTETFNIRVGANASYKTATRVHSLQAVYLEKSVNEVNTAQSALLDGRIEWPLDGMPWNFFIHGLGEYDQFKAFDARLSGDTGVGYEWIQNDFTTLTTRLGVAASHEIGGPDDDITPEYLAGVEYKHKFDDTHSFSVKADYYPAMADVSDFRLNTQASWEMAVAPDWGLSLKFSVIDRYDSTPHGAKPNDLDYSTLLIWGF